MESFFEEASTTLRCAHFRLGTCIREYVGTWYEDVVESTFVAKWSMVIVPQYCMHTQSQQTIATKVSTADRNSPRSKLIN